MPPIPDEPHFDELSDLVLECLDRIERGDDSAIDAICAEHPGQAEALRSRLATLSDAGLLTEHRDAAIPERLGDFRLGECLGGGGMGVVYAAEQESLGRQVALKLIRPDQLYFPETRRRFRREVEIVARLAHPGIVPIYTVGEEAGLPYFAMECVVGATLAELLAEVVAARGDEPRALAGADLASALQRVLRRRTAVGATPPAVATGAFGRSWTESCLRLVSQVAQALEHAHERGVLHRDLKPSNVMVTPEGRALLFDFGLASASEVAGMTRTGSQVGSLPYMAPEQLRDGPVDERTDVYGLGALLCELLTLRPPHEARHREALVQAILLGEPVPLRARNPSLSRDLETVLHKALEHVPERRYATVADFARDIGHVLARRPVEARRSGPLERSLRWTQRHPARATALALAVLLLVGGPTALAIQRGLAADRIQRALDDSEEQRRLAQAEQQRAEEQRQRAEEQTQRAEEEAQRAEANFDSALNAVRRFLHDIHEEGLDHVPGIQATRLSLMDEALPLYAELMEQRPDDWSLRLGWGEMNRTVAELHRELEQLDEAEAHYRVQLDILDEQVRNRAHNWIDRRNLVGIYNNLALLYGVRGERERVVDHYREAIALLDPESTDPDVLVTLANVQRNLADVLRELEHHDEADEVCTRAERAAQAAVDARLGEGDGAASREELRHARFELGNIYSVRAVLESDRGDAAAAVRAVARSLPLLKAVAEEEPSRADRVSQVAMAFMNSSPLLAMEGHQAEAEEVAAYGVLLSERLVALEPAVRSHVRTLVGCLNNQAFVLVEADRKLEAEPLMRRGLALIEDIVRAAPEVYESLLWHGQACHNYSTLMVQLDREEEAIDPALRGRESVLRALEIRPDDPYLRTLLARFCINEAWGRVVRGEWARAWALVDEAIEHHGDDDSNRVVAAELLARCLELAPVAEREALRGAALVHLARGLELGYDEPGYLETAPELDALRGSPELQALIASRREGRP